MYHTYRMPKYCECEKHCNKCKPITCCVGPTGSSGPAGPPGKNGANGANGANGPMGPTGGSPLDFLYFNDNEQYYISPTFDSATKRFIGLGATKEYRADRPPRLPFLRTVGYTVSHDFSLEEIAFFVKFSDAYTDSTEEILFTAGVCVSPGETGIDTYDFVATTSTYGIIHDLSFGFTEPIKPVVILANSIIAISILIQNNSNQSVATNIAVTLGGKYINLNVFQNFNNNKTIIKRSAEENKNNLLFN